MAARFIAFPFAAFGAAIIAHWRCGAAGAAARLVRCGAMARALARRGGDADIKAVIAFDP